MDCLRVAATSTITSRRVVVRTLSHERSPERLRVSSSAKKRELRLGNLDAIRDWGHARDYVRAMWLMLQHSEPDDYVVATGQGRTVRDFVEAAFHAVGLDWQKYVRVAPEFFRPAENVPFVGSTTRARGKLRWKAEIAFTELVGEMTSADLRSK